MATLMLSVMGVVAQFERTVIQERQREGIALAKKAGKYKGRKRSLTPARIAELRKSVNAGKETKAAIARSFGISRQTLYESMRAA